ncbi:MAG TPA: hypothetical protein VNA15_04060 [Candidatus Angelobacter sp.]|nr:hypothetical protein [Candidatus Angelobacter sp.]
MAKRSGWLESAVRRQPATTNGMIMVRAGSCYNCLNCGNTGGCG